MCRAITCRTCDRPTWAGCGAHVEAVLGHVPVDQRCSCREKASASKEGKPKSGLVRRLFGR